MLMVFKGGVGFHMVDIAERFGPGAVEFFYKVSTTADVMLSPTPG